MKLEYLNFWKEYCDKNGGLFSLLDCGVSWGDYPYELRNFKKLDRWVSVTAFNFQASLKWTVKNKNYRGLK